MASSLLNAVSLRPKWWSSMSSSVLSLVVLFFALEADARAIATAVAIASGFHGVGAGAIAVDDGDGDARDGKSWLMRMLYHFHASGEGRVTSAAPDVMQEGSSWLRRTMAADRKARSDVKQLWSCRLPWYEWATSMWVMRSKTSSASRSFVQPS